jgi:hypothetical protein
MSGHMVEGAHWPKVHLAENYNEVHLVEHLKSGLNETCS